MRNVIAYTNLVMAIMRDKHREDLLPLGELELDIIDTLLNSLYNKGNERSQILRLRFGLDGEKFILENVGRRFLITGDRVRQIEMKNLRKLRHPSRSKFLQPLFVGPYQDGNAILQMSINELELSVRAYNALKVKGIKTLGELAQKSESEILRTKSFGRKSLNELKDKLAEYGLCFGMNISG